MLPVKTNLHFKGVFHSFHYILQNYNQSGRVLYRALLTRPHTLTRTRPHIQKQQVARRGDNTELMGTPEIATCASSPSTSRVL